MNRAHGAALAVAALLVLAGCAGSPPGSVAAEDGGTSATDRTEQPSTPESTPMPAQNETNVSDDRVELPPGVTLDGVVNASALIEAHREALTRSGYSFVLETNLSSTFAGGVEQWAVQNGTVAAGLSPFRLRTVSRVLFENESASPPTTVSDAWGNESTVVARTQRGNLTQVQQVDRRVGGFSTGQGGAGPGGGPGMGPGSAPSVDALVTQTAVLETVLRSGRFEVTDVRQDGNLTLVTLTATAFDDAALGPGRNVTAFEASLLVDEEGRVRSMTYTLAFENGDDPAIRYRYRLTDVGQVTVEKPEWVAGAFEPVSTSVSMQTVEDNALRLANEGDEALPAGSTIRLRHDGSTVTFQLDDALRPGQAVFLYVDADGTPRLATGQPPSDARRLDGSYEVVVQTPGGRVVFQGQVTIQQNQ